MDKFVNLHVHTAAGSLLDGLIKINELFDYTKQLQQPATVITDHGNMYAIAKAAQYSQSVNQKFIPGCEAYWVQNALLKGKTELSSEIDVSRKHLLLLAKNNEGYKRLMKICSWGHTEGYYYRPRIDDSTLEKFGTDGIIATSACLVGLPAQKLLQDDYQGAKQVVQHYASLFKDGYYLEIQPVFDDGGKQVKVNKGLIEISKELGIPLVATTDAHYLKREDKIIHDILLCIQSKTTLDDPNKWTFSGNSYFIMTRDEILQMFKEHGHEALDQKYVEEAVNNTLLIANQCNVHFEFGKHYLPKIDPYKDEEDKNLLKQFEVFELRRLTEVMKKNNIDINEAKNHLDISSEYLRFLAIHGWHGMYAQNVLDERHLSLMFHELDTIISMGFPSYFLILYRILFACNQLNIISGPGRGCHYKNNLVNVLNKGMQKINNININDYVLAVDGKYHKVVNVYEYDCDEDLVEIMAENDKLINGTTKDHKVLGIKKSDYIDGKKYQLGELKWYPIDELNIDDYLIQIS